LAGATVASGLFNLPAMVRAVPSFQGRHCGIAILNHLRELVEARSDLDGVYLETANEANVAYYTRNGFEVIGLVLSAGGQDVADVREYKGVSR
jgi:GNAT superfamily N-acetyltransferase